jgi:hypothetical protein
MCDFLWGHGIEGHRSWEPGLSQPYSFTPLMRVDGFNFNIAQYTGVKEGGPALVGRKDFF